MLAQRSCTELGFRFAAKLSRQSTRSIDVRNCGRGIKLFGRVCALTAGNYTRFYLKIVDPAQFLSSKQLYSIIEADN